MCTTLGSDTQGYVLQEVFNNKSRLKTYKKRSMPLMCTALGADTLRLRKPYYR